MHSRQSIFRRLWGGRSVGNVHVPSAAENSAIRILAGLKKSLSEAKGLPAKNGWVYLINDTNDFLNWQFGIQSWSSSQCARVHEIMAERESYFSRRTIPYLMIVTPEKSVAYKEWLPAGLDAVPDASNRPAKYLADQYPAVVAYPHAHLNEMKCNGLLYYKGDTHVNWLGAYHLYRYTIDAIRSRGFSTRNAIPFNQLYADIASWDGDVLVQIPPHAKAEFERDADLWRPQFLDETMLTYTLIPQHKKAVRLAEPDVFRTGRPERETVVTINPDETLPRALIFRDSTASLIIDYLAEHFSRAVFVWHEDDLIGDLIEQEKPDVVLHFKAERFLSTLPIMSAVSSNPNRVADAIPGHCVEGKE